MLVLGGDLGSKGHTLGAESGARCIKARMMTYALCMQGYEVKIVVAAGKAGPKKYPRQLLTMAEMMKRFILRSSLSFNVTALQEECWGTKTEIRAALEFRNSQRGGSRHALHVTTSWYHKGRVEMIAKMAFGESVVVHTAYGKLSNAIIEVPKFIIQYFVLLYEMRNQPTAQ